MEPEILDFHCLRWAELPQIALYMDQVLLVINGALAPLMAGGGSAVTATMINNYVKMKLADPAEKKKYNRSHMARFVMICLLKRVLSMQEISAVLEQLAEGRGEEGAYDLFCQELEQRLKDPTGPDTLPCPPAPAAAIRALACKLQVERLLAENRADQKAAAEKES